MDRVLKVAVSGVGRYGELLLRHLVEDAEHLGISVTGFTARHSMRRKAIESEFGLPGFPDIHDLLQSFKIDVLCVSTPDHLHYEDSLCALHGGSNVFVQKPMTTCSKEAKRLCSVAARRGLLLGVDFHKRFDPDILKLRQMLRGGELGDPLYLTAHMEDRVEVPTEWLGWARSTSPIWFLGTHLFDLVWFLTGREVKRVFAVAGKQLLARRGVETLDYAQIILEGEDGLTASITCGWVLPDSFEAVVRQGITLTCTNGTVVIDSQDRGVRVARGTKTETLNNHVSFRRATGRGERYGGYAFAGLESFLEDIRSGRQQITGASGEDGLRSTRIAAAVDQSIFSGLPVFVAPGRGAAGSRSITPSTDEAGKKP